MASFVTHYFLGKRIRDHFGPKLEGLIQGQENLYLSGSQGPDLFFFQVSKRVKGEKDLGTLFHDWPSRSLLEGLKRFRPRLAQKPRDLACFLSLCDHFLVDTSIYPTVNVLARLGFDHISIEGELGRYFTKKNGQGLNGLRQSRLFAPSYDLKAILTVYQDSDATLSDIQASTRDSKRVRKISQPRGPWQEKTLLDLLKVAKLNRPLGNQLMPQIPYPRVEKTDQILMDILRGCPQKAATFTEAIYLWLTEGPPLPDLVDLDLSGRKQ